MDKGIGRFDPNPEIAAAWDRLYIGDFIRNDIQLLEHEYSELTQETLGKLTYREAHQMAKSLGKKWEYPIFE